MRSVTTTRGFTLRSRTKFYPKSRKRGPGSISACSTGPAGTMWLHKKPAVSKVPIYQVPIEQPHLYRFYSTCTLKYLYNRCIYKLVNTELLIIIFCRKVINPIRWRERERERDFDHDRIQNKAILKFKTILSSSPSLLSYKTFNYYYFFI